MDGTSSFHSLRLSRRGFVAAGFGAGAVALGAGSAIAADHPSMTYMRQVAKDLLAANRQGTVASFMRAIQRHADVPEIALYSLGQYKPSPSGGYEPWALQVVELRDGVIGEITFFLSTKTLFPLFGLPLEFEG